MADAAGGRSGWGRAVLVVSLGLNLLVAGVIAGGAMRGHHRPPPEIGGVTLGPFTEAFSAADREAIRRAALAEGTRLREVRRAGWAETERLLATLRAEPFDPGAAAAAFAQMQAQARGRIAIGERLMLERLGAMTAEERRAFAARAEEILRRGPGRRHGG